MTLKTARHLVVLALAPLVLMGSLSPAAQWEKGERAAGDARLELAALKGEARSLTVHIDGP